MSIVAMTAADAPLVLVDDLDGFPGAPFNQNVLTSAGASVRAEVEWHVAPELTQTVVFNTGRSTVILLPSLHVVDVSSVRDLTDAAAPVVLDGWRVDKRTGVLSRDAGWPRFVEVTFTHGYATCPAELLPVVLERVQRFKSGGVRQESIGSRSVTLANTAEESSVVSLARYKLPPRP